MSDKTPKTCFVIAPIDEPESEVRRRSDQILNHVIRPAVEPCGYAKPVRADEIDEPGNITSQVIQHVAEDDLVVADLTGQNPNVFYELAIRHARRRPFVQIAELGERIPFDVYGQRTIFLDHKNLDSVAEAIDSMTEQIKSFQDKDAQVETPISMSFDLQILQSGNTEERYLADVLSELSNIRAAISHSAERSMASHTSELMRLEERFDHVLNEAVHRGRRRRSRTPEDAMILDLARMDAARGRGRHVLPIALSLLRDDLPWLYEAGMELHRSRSQSDHPEVVMLAEELLRLVELSNDILHLPPELREAVEEVRQAIQQILHGG